MTILSLEIFKMGQKSEMDKLLAQKLLHRQFGLLTSPVIRKLQDGLLNVQLFFVGHHRKNSVPGREERRKTEVTDG